MSEQKTTRKILIGYDHSKLSNYMLEWIVNKKIVSPSEDITLAIAIDDISQYMGGAIDDNAVSDDEAREGLDFSSSWFRSKGFFVKQKLLSGKPGKALKDFAEANKIELVIVGRRGLGFIKRICIGLFKSSFEMFYIDSKPKSRR